MKCTCGFDNAPDARFCGNCRLALGDTPDNVTSAAAVPTIAPRRPVATGHRRTPARPLSRVGIALVAIVVVIAAAGYWWMNRPPGRYKTDNSGLYRISANGKYGFMDRSEKTIITPQFDQTYGFSEGLAPVQIGTKWGYINSEGTVVITPQFNIAESFRYGRGAVKLGERWGFIDKSGKYISNPNFLLVGSFTGDFAPVRTEEGEDAFVSRSGKIVLSGKYGVLHEATLKGFTEGLAPVSSGGKWGFIDTTGKWVVDPQFESALNFAGGLAPVLVGGRWGYINHKGKFVVNPQYDFGEEFHDGYAIFSSSGKFGFIDTKGRVVVEAKLLGVGDFSEGLAPVRTEDGCGFIDATGKMVIRPQFDQVESFQNGLAHVTVLGKKAYITKTGTFVIDPFPGTNVSAERARLAADPDAIETAKQKRALGEVRSIATACQAFSTDHGERYPNTGHNGISQYAIVAGSKLRPFIAPNYIMAMYEKDPWGNPYLYGISPGASTFVVICTGSDGKNSLEEIPRKSILTSCYEDEIVWETDAFIQKPDGPQRNCKETVQAAENAPVTDFSIAQVHQPQLLVKDRMVVSLTVSAGNQVYYLDYRKKTLGKLDAATREMTDLLSIPNSPSAIRAYGDRLYFCETGTEVNKYKDGTLSYFDLSSKDRNTIASHLEYPASLSIDGHGNVYVLECAGSSTSFGGNNRLLKFETGKLQPEVVLPHLALPTAVVVDEKGDIFIGTMGAGSPGDSGTLLRFASVGTTKPETLLTGLPSVHDMFLDTYGNLYIAGMGKDNGEKTGIVCLRKGAKKAETIARGYQVSAITLDLSNNIYYALGRGADGIYRIAK